MHASTDTIIMQLLQHRIAVLDQYRVYVIDMHCLRVDLRCGNAGCALQQLVIPASRTTAGFIPSSQVAQFHAQHCRLQTVQA